jgi:hypothetical protein
VAQHHLEPKHKRNPENLAVKEARLQYIDIPYPILPVPHRVLVIPLDIPIVT